LRVLKRSGVILTLLIASGCASQVALLGSPNFVKEHISDVVGLEVEWARVSNEIKIAQMFGFNLQSVKEEMKKYNDAYFVYYYAAQTYLVNGDLARYKQAVGRAEHTLQKMQELLRGEADKKLEDRAETLTF